MSVLYRGMRTHLTLSKLIVALVMFVWFAPISYAQSNDGPKNAIPTGKFVVSKNNETVQMVVSTNQLLVLDEDIEKASVHNDAVINVRPMGRKELMIQAKSTGVTQVDLYAPQNKVYSVQVVVLGDARELETILKNHFPMASLSVRPIQNAVIIAGHVTADEHVEQVVAIAEQYYPTVINMIQVIGVHTIMLHTQVMEVSRTKLRELSIDWALGFGDDFVQQSVSGTIGGGATAANTILNTGNETFKFGVLEDGNRFFSFVRFLRQNNLVKVMADPTVVAIDGRPASFNSGGEFPILVPAGLGQVGIEFREFGTRLDFVAKVRGDGRIWLEVRPTISEIDPSRSVTIQGTTVPGLRSRFVDTAVELRAGQTLALAGLLQVRTESQSIGVPGLADMPYLGALFRSNREVQNEVELLITVTPDFAGAMDPHEVPVGGPGFNSYSPSDKELYFKGYIETPPACPPTEGGVCLPGQPGMELPVQSYPVENGVVPSESGMAIPSPGYQAINVLPAQQNLPQVDPAAYRISENGAPMKN